MFADGHGVYLGDHVPVVVDGATAGSAVLIVRRPPAGEPPSRSQVVWGWEAGSAEGASAILRWMGDMADSWDVWGLMAARFGSPLLERLVVGGAEREERRRADEQAMDRAEEEKRLRRSRQVDLFVHDGRGKRPALSLESADQSKPFWKMTFSERWERERVLDWMRWQKPRFLEWRELVAAEGAVALERLVIAGMRVTEADLKARGLSSGGRRPLRFWRGE